MRTLIDDIIAIFFGILIIVLGVVLLSPQAANLGNFVNNLSLPANTHATPRGEVLPSADLEKIIVQLGNSQQTDYQKEALLAKLTDKVITLPVTVSQVTPCQGCGFGYAAEVTARYQQCDINFKVGAEAAVEIQKNSSLSITAQIKRTKLFGYSLQLYLDNVQF